VMAKVLAERVPIIGGLAENRVRRLLTAVVGHLHFKLPRSGGAPRVEDYLASIDANRQNLDGVLRFAFKAADLPLWILLFCCGLPLAALVWWLGG